MVHVVVLGAGVVGLSSALVLQANGHFVEIVAEFVPPEDAKDWEKTQEGDSPIYTSIRAGAVWRSFAMKPPAAQTVDGVHEDNEERLARWEIDTFKMLWKLTEDPNSGVTRTEALELFTSKPAYKRKLVFAGDAVASQEAWSDPWFKDFIPGYEQLEAPHADLPNGFEFGIRFSTVDIDPARYLPFLLKKFKSGGGKVTQRKVASLSELVTPQVDCIVNCTGLGAAFLLDTVYTSQLPDRNMFPARGITLCLISPSTKRYTALDGETVTYIIPRFDKEGTVILGGSFEPEVWSKDVREAEVLRILTSCLLIDRSIANVLGDTTGMSDHEIVAGLRSKIDVRTGMRPCRRGGIRVEAEWRDSQDERILVIHNYGHAGWGFQSSFGTAMDVLQELHGEDMSTSAEADGLLQGLAEEPAAKKKRVRLDHEVQSVGIFRKALMWVQSKL